MSIRTAWDKIALEYKMMVEQGRRRKRYVYEEMYETSCQMKGGVPEGKAFEEFGRRCGLQSYMKLGGLLEQNRKNGSKNLRNLLRTEMTDAFEQRKHQARRPGGGSRDKTAASAVHTLVRGHGYDCCSGTDGIQIKHKEERNGVRKGNQGVLEG